MEPTLFLISGLGNPGSTYENNRHNIGFRIVDHLAAANDIALNKNKHNILFGRGRIHNHSVILSKPMAYMNRSGPPIQALLDYFKISQNFLIVIHDDLDLPFQRIKIKKNGGHGGHNGLRSILSSLGNNDFIRIRVGIGRPEHQGAVSHYVLTDFNTDETPFVDGMLSQVAKIVASILEKGVQFTMNQFHDRMRNKIL